MAFNHSDTDRIAVYPNRPQKTMGYLGNLRLDCEFPICVFSYLYSNKSE